MYPYGSSTYQASSCNSLYYGAGNTTSVGSLIACQSLATAYAGIFDLGGNVYEWEDSCDLTGQQSHCRLRGGCYGNDSDHLHCGDASYDVRDFVYDNRGFRCCSDTVSSPNTSSPSCQNLTTQCQGESCCTSITVPGGSFPMGRSTDSTVSDYYPSGNADELPEHTATLARFALDKCEVTAGRFRQFVTAYDTWHGTNGNPVSGAGANPNSAGTSWVDSWTSSSSDLAEDAATLQTDLICNVAPPTWTDVAGSNEGYPINCASWYEAFAFCIWEGGRLPTEAEWEYVAAGGNQNRRFPWGDAAPDSSLTNGAVGSPQSPLVLVGSFPGGAGYWGHLDLAGSVWPSLSRPGEPQIHPLRPAAARPL